MQSRRCAGMALALALGLGLGTHQPVQALEIGHARMVSGAGQALRLIVPLKDLSDVQADTLVVRLADAAAWQENGLTAPVPLTDLTVTIQPGADARQRQLLVSASSAPRGEVVDMLLELETATQQRRIQVSFIVPTQAVRGSSQIQVPRVGAAQARAAGVTVRRGQTLSGIAQAHRHNDVSMYQMLAALYQANPQAFIARNMNLLRAGSTLTLPDAQTVRAIDSAEARRIFLAHSEAFARYRAGVASAADAVAGGSPESGQLASAQSPAPVVSTDPGDRVRLSSVIPTAGASTLGGESAMAESAADERVVQARAEQDIVARLTQLERNVADMSQVLAAARSLPDTAVGATPEVAVDVAPDATHTADASSENLASGLPAGIPVAQVEPSGGVRWTDNLPLWITGILTVLAIMVAWLMRRANARSQPYDAYEDDDLPAEPSDAMREQFARRLADIDLDLDDASEPLPAAPAATDDASVPASRG